MIIPLTVGGWGNSAYSLWEKREVSKAGFAVLEVMVPTSWWHPKNRTNKKITPKMVLSNPAFVISGPWLFLVHLSSWGLENSLASWGQVAQFLTLQMKVGIHFSMRVTELCFKLTKKRKGKKKGKRIWVRFKGMMHGKGKLSKLFSTYMFRCFYFL